MRNENGPVAHGKDGFLDVMEEDHARAFLHTGDAIIGLLMNALEGKQPNLIATREPYERFKHLCDQIDRTVDIDASIDRDDDVPVLVVSLTTSGRRKEVIELRIEPSRLLYGVDRAAFVDVIAEAPKAVRKVEEDEIEEQDFQPVPAVAVSAPVALHETEIAFVGREHLGQFKNLRAGLRTFLISEAINMNPPDNLLDSLLNAAELNGGLDWQTRDGLQSRMKVGFRRVLGKEGIAASNVSDLPERLLMWLKLNAPTSTAESSS
jgi:hypothetical protein